LLLSLLTGQKVLPAYAPVVTEKGIVTLAIDSWCFGERQREKGLPQRRINDGVLSPVMASVRLGA